MAHGRLLDKDMVIINHYFSCGLNKDEAWRRSGKKWAQELSYLFFRRPEVKAEIARRMKKMEKKTELSANLLIDRLVSIVESYFALSKYKKVDEAGKLFWDFTGATQEELVAVNDLEKVGALDPNTAIDKLVRILGMYKDKLEHTGKDGEAIKVELTNEELARKLAFLLTQGTKE